MKFSTLFRSLTECPYRVFAICLTAVWMLGAAFSAWGMPQLPEPDLSWRNIAVDSKKMAVFCIMRDSHGLMWLGTNNGLYFYDGVATHPVGMRELAGTQIYSLVERDEALYIGSNNGLKRYDYRSGGITPDFAGTPREIRSLLLVNDELWIGGLDGLCRLDLSTGEIENPDRGLPHRSVYSLLRDSRGILYAGTYNGLARWDANEGSFHTVHIKTDNVRRTPLFANCLLEGDDKESIYVGGEKGLYRYLPYSDSWEMISSVDGSNIKSLSNGNRGHILIGTDNGVFDLCGDSLRHYRHDSRQELSLADNEIWCIMADDDQNIWAGHERGFSIAANSSAIRNIKISTLADTGEGNEIYCILRDRGNELWLGGSNGIIRLGNDGRRRWYRHDTSPRALSHNRVRGILEDSEGEIWLATDGGINRLDRGSDSFDVFHLTDSAGGHKSNWVYAIIEDGGRMWTGSFLSGIHDTERSKFRRGGGTVTADRTFSTESASPGDLHLRNDFVNNILKDKEGNLWILLYRDSVVTRYSPASHETESFDIHKLTGEYPSVITSDRRGRIWCAVKGGAVILRPGGETRTVRFPHTNGDESIMAAGKVGDGIWVSTQSNVWAIDPEGREARIVPLPQRAYTSIYEDTVSRKVYLGGTDEITEVDVAGILTNPRHDIIRMALDRREDGEPDLSGIRSGAEGLRLPYGGSATLIVSTLNYSPEDVQRYMYKLAKSESDTVGGWIVMPEGSNTITFTDLKMGSYSILVKTPGSAMAPLAIPLRVAAPAALSWWAIALYILAAGGMVYWIVWYIKNKNLRKYREQERQTALENVERKLSFLSDISHDLKTPLSMIIGPVSLMKERAEEPETKRKLEAVYDNAVRLNNMIHRTLELRHLEDSEENLLIMSTFDAVGFCRTVFEVFRENNPYKTFLFHSTCPQLLIDADAVKLESVVTNLLSNACKYSEEGATITLGISRRGESVEIVVSDDGMGIEERDQPLVFQRMFRAPSTSHLREGTGLGLYLIKRYVEMMGGAVELYSKAGEGTTFAITLPLSERIPAEIPERSADSDDSRERILIVEDNLQISEFIYSLLCEQYICERAENGKAGLAIAASFNPDLIIADEMMPIMSGLEMVERMKQNPRLASTPIIMLTAKSDNNTENASIKLGIEVFMAKPFEPNALLGRIRQLLKSRDEIKEKVRIQTITEAQAHPIEAESANEKILARIAKAIEENISDPDLNVNMLCEKCDISNKQLYRLIKKYMDTAPLDYIRRVRLQKGAVLLSQNRFTVSEISYMVGFKTPSYFAKCFQNQFGVKPSQYKGDN